MFTITIVIVVHIDITIVLLLPFFFFFCFFLFSLSWYITAVICWLDFRWANFIVCIHYFKIQFLLRSLASHHELWSWPLHSPIDLAALSSSFVALWICPICHVGSRPEDGLFFSLAPLNSKAPMRSREVWSKFAGPRRSGANLADLKKSKRQWKSVKRWQWRRITCPLDLETACIGISIWWGKTTTEKGARVQMI